MHFVFCCAATVLLCGICNLVVMLLRTKQRHFSLSVGNIYDIGKKVINWDRIHPETNGRAILRRVHAHYLKIGSYVISRIFTFGAITSVERTYAVCTVHVRIVHVRVHMYFALRPKSH